LNSDYLLLHDVKQRGTFHCARWQRDYLPDLCWISTTVDCPQPASSVVLGDFPTVSTYLQLFTLASSFRKAATEKLVEKIVKHDSWPIQPDILSPPLLRLTSRKPLWWDLQPVDIKRRWRHNWKSAQVVNSHLVCDPTIGNRVLTPLCNSGLC